MADTGYPHLVFLLPESGFDKDALAALLAEVAPEGSVEDKPLRLDLTLDGYSFSFWFEDAEGVAERYADYLPDGARRRWLTRVVDMIDFSGPADPDGAHAADARRLLDALVARDGVEVFSEESRRFLGMDYGDRTDEAASAEQPELTPAPAPEPLPEPALATPEVPAAAEASTPAPQPEVAEAPAPEPLPDPTVQAEPGEEEQEKKGFFRRMFGRR